MASPSFPLLDTSREMCRQRTRKTAWVGRQYKFAASDGTGKFTWLARGERAPELSRRCVLLDDMVYDKLPTTFDTHFYVAINRRGDEMWGAGGR